MAGGDTAWEVAIGCADVAEYKEDAVGGGREVVDAAPVVGGREVALVVVAAREVVGREVVARGEVERGVVVARAVEVEIGAVVEAEVEAAAEAEDEASTVGVADEALAEVAFAPSARRMALEKAPGDPKRRGA